jgi:hypothetical protein
MIYFQPVLTEEEQDRDDMPSFVVYRDYENVKADYPSHDIQVLSYDDVEDPDFVDVNYGAGMNWDALNFDLGYFWAKVSQYLTEKQQDEIIKDIVEYHNRIDLNDKQLKAWYYD